MAFVAAFFISVSGANAATPVPELDDESEDALIAVPSTDSRRSASGAPPAVGGKQRTPIEVATSEPWSVPPIPWRGSLTLDLDRYRQDRLPAQGATTTRLNLTGSSFVLAPWFLRLTGGVGMTQTRTTENQTNESSNAALSGAYLQSSRYPGSVSLSAAQSKTDTGSVEFKSLNWAHAYQPADSSYRSNFVYNISDVSAGGGASTISQHLVGGLNYRVPSEIPQSVALNGSVSRTDSAGSGGSNSVSLNGSHSVYFDDYVLTVNSDASLNRTAATGAERLELRQLSAGSNVDWIPSDDYPLRLHGNARHFASRSASGTTGAGADLNTTLVVAGADYPHNQNWTFSGTATAAHVQNGGETSRSFNAAGGAAWSGDPFGRKLAEWDYLLSYRATGTGDYGNATSSSGSQSSAAAVLSAGVSQGLGRGLPSSFLGSNQNLRLTQDVSAVRVFSATRAGSTFQLGHAAGYVSNLATTSQSTANAAADASDTRSFGDSRSAYQRIGASLNGSMTLNARENLSYSARIGLSRQAASSSFGPWVGGLNGLGAYSNARFANVTGLRYSASYAVFARQRSQEDPSTDGVAVDHTFSQSWAWRLGLLAWSAANTVTMDSSGKLWVQIRLSVTREFGGVL